MLFPLLGSRMCTTVFTDTNECPCARILLIPLPFQIAPHVFNEFPLQLLLTEEVHHFLDDVHSEPRSVPEVQSLNLIFGPSPTQWILVGGSPSTRSS